MRRLALFIVVLMGISLNAQQLAFPGAEGYGRYTTGGRTGSVYHVTNLNDSGAGSFRDAVSQSNRIVIFDVGGVINLNSVVVVNKNITIAGQTAPGGGITLFGERLAFNGNSGNNIIRYIRVRLKRSAGDTDAMSISDGKDNFIFDHVSVSWGADGTFDINSDGSDNITIQDCIIGQGSNFRNHSTGGLIQCGPISYIRTLWIDNKTRNPKIRFEHEIINNVLYNWGTDGIIMGDTENADSHCNLVGNYFIAGPSSSTGSYVSRPTARYFVYPSDNYLDIDKNGVLDGSLINSATGYKTATVVETPFNHPGVNTVLSPQDAVAHIIENAGASMVRDEVDKLLINQLKSYGTLGAIIEDETSNGISNGGVGVVVNGSKPQDTDNDGMPDAWETANGLNINVDDAMIIAGNGYANIENYINSINSPFEFLESPESVSVASKTTSSITLNWSLNEEDATQVIIEYSTDNSFSNTMSVDATETSVIIEGLESYTTYNIRLKSVNDEIESVYTNPIAVRTNADAIAPKPSFNPSPANGSTLDNNKYISFSWENTTGPGAGTVYYDFILGKSEGAMDTISRNLSNTSYNMNELDPGTTYFWRIRTRNNLGADQGVLWSFTTGAQLDRNRVLYIPFDETSGNTAENLNGSENAVAKNITPNWAAGKLNNSINLAPTQTETGMVVPYYGDLYMYNTSFTISFWMKSNINDNADDIYVLHKGTHNTDNGGTGRWIGIQLKKGERLTFGIDDNSSKTTIDLTDNPNQYFNKQWHMVTFVRDIEQDQLRVYMDGTLAKSTTDNTGNIAETADLAIGNNNTGYDTPFNGSIDELMIYKNALLEEEILAQYNNPSNAIKFLKSNTKELIVYPVPFKDALTIVNPETRTQELLLHIYDLSGQEVYSAKLSKQGPTIQIERLNHLSNGLYTCMITGSNHTYLKKVIKF